MAGRQTAKRRTSASNQNGEAEQASMVMAQLFEMDITCELLERIIRYSRDDSPKTVTSLRGAVELYVDINENIKFIDDLIRLEIGNSDDLAHIARVIAYDSRDLFRKSLNLFQIRN